MSAVSPSQTSLGQQLGRFLLIGGSSVCIDLLTYRALLEMSLDTSIAKGISYVVGMVWGYLGNKFWTFRVEAVSLGEPVIYVMLYATTLGINVSVNAVVLASCGPSAKWLAFLLATGTSTVLNFLGMKFLAFRQRGLSTS